jgi:hypothetical protein
MKIRLAGLEEWADSNVCTVRRKQVGAYAGGHTYSGFKQKYLQYSTCPSCQACLMLAATVLLLLLPWAESSLVTTAFDWFGCRALILRGEGLTRAFRRVLRACRPN